MKAIRRFAVRTVLPERLAPLDRLATNLRWSWHVETRDLFESIDPDLWRKVGRDPVRLLGEVPADRWRELAEDVISAGYLIVFGMIQRLYRKRAVADCIELTESIECVR